MTVNLAPVRKESDIHRLWEIGFSEKEPEWAKWNAPYFEEYSAYSYQDFVEKEIFYSSPHSLGIYVDNLLVGLVFRHWEDERTRWMEIGIIIYDDHYWNSGYGTQALKQWMTKTFEAFPEIEHLGLTTWSGNRRMMSCAKKIGMRQEARIRKVRYWQGVYYDSVKYGVLREEWQDLSEDS